jgi:hypothetical protein
MLNKFIFYVILYLITIIFSTLSHAQNKTTRISELESLYKQLKFEEALGQGKKILAHPERLGTDELALVHQYLGVIYYSVGSQDSSRSHFLSYLDLKPDGDLDPVNFSPKIVSFFEKIKNEYRSNVNTYESLAYTRYIYIDDPRPGAGWRSAILPGWGQIYKNQKRRGIIFGSSFWVTALITGVAYYFEDQYHQDYINSQTPEDIDTNYDKYNTWYKVRRSFSWITASIWILNIADALWTPYPKAQFTILPYSPTPYSLKIHLN